MYLTILCITLALAFTVMDGYQISQKLPSFPSMKKCVQLITSVGLSVVFIQVPTQVHAADGQKLFGTYCAACHTGGGNLFDKDKTLFKDQLQTNGYTDIDKISALIKSGKGLMLPTPMLNDPEKNAVATYVLEMADNQWKTNKETTTNQ